MMAADTVLQQYFTELQSEVKAIAVNADLETAYTELEGAFTEQVSRLMSEMGLLAAEPELCPFQGTALWPGYRPTRCRMTLTGWMSL